ncbi:MAG: hypothetical protein QF773_04080, partial [Lentisphaeria bacterium]|nr:hypothetical protein [Lentisphaeria bacterium]
MITATIILILCTLLLGSAMLKCWFVAKRPGTNTKCLISLLLLLGGGDSPRLAKRRFRADVDDVGPLPSQLESALDRRLNGGADAFA